MTIYGDGKRFRFMQHSCMQKLILFGHISVSVIRKGYVSMKIRFMRLQ